jgi:hypothetical protein
MIRALIFVAVLTLVGMGWLHHRASQAVAAQITALRPHVLVRYEGLRAWPAQPIELQGVTLEPVGSWRDGFGLPIGYRLRAETLVWRDADVATGQRTLQLEGLQMPVDGLPEKWSLPLQRAGFNTLTGLLQVEQQPPLGGLPWQWTLTWRTNEGVTARLTSRFEAGPDFPAFTLKGMTLVDAALTIDDRGDVLNRLQHSEALAARLTVNAWADATSQRVLSRLAEAGWTLPDRLATTLQRGLREPQSFSLTMAPPAPARLDQVNLYTADDRWTLLGVDAELSPPPIAKP